jgi:predicted MFS family arabinose efflux permease
MLMVAGVSTLLLVTEWGGQQYAWASAQVLGLIVASVVLLGTFLYRESKAEEPILSLHLFKNGVFRIATPVLFILGAALFGSLVYISLYFQIVNGLSPTQAGLHLIPMTFGMIPASIISGRLISRNGRYKIFPMIGMAMASVAMGLLGMLTTTTGSWAISFYLFLLGLGLGQVMQVMILAVQNAIPPREMGAGTAATGFFRSLGGAIGSATFGAVLSSRLTHNLHQAAHTTSTQLNAQAVHALPPAAQHVVFEAFTKSTNTVFLLAAGLTFIGFVLTWFLPEMTLRGSGPAKPQTVEPS